MRPRRPLNYHHLHYFWMVAKSGGISRACEALDVAPSTVSAQVSALERSLGRRLFRRAGRNLALTEAGQAAFRLAEDIFRLGHDLRQAVEGDGGSPERLAVGVADVVPKLVAAQLLQPVLESPQGVSLLCREGKPSALLAELVLHHLDLVILDAPLGPGSEVRAYSHPLGSSAVVVLGTAELVARHGPGFPRSLHRAPLLMPTYESALRPLLDRWLGDLDLEPRLVGELDDSALMKALAQGGAGLVPVPEVAAGEAQRQYGLERLGRLEPLRITFYAVTAERKLERPALARIAAARRDLFS